jgi:hypothetical protein
MPLLFYFFLTCLSYVTRTLHRHGLLGAADWIAHKTTPPLPPGANKTTFCHYQSLQSKLQECPLSPVTHVRGVEAEPRGGAAAEAALPLNELGAVLGAVPTRRARQAGWAPQLLPVVRA